MDDVFSVKTIIIDIVSRFSIGFFILCIIGSLYNGQFEAMPIFFIFVILGIIMLLLSGKAEISETGFKVSIPIGIFYISWNEVEYIELGSGNLVISGNGKKLCYPTPSLWSGKNKIRAVELLFKVIKEKNLEIKQSNRAILPIYKNTRIKNN